RADHAARAEPADHDGLGAQLRAPAHLDRGEERVQVAVQDRAAGVVTVRPETLRGAPAHLLAAAHARTLLPRSDTMPHPPGTRLTISSGRSAAELASPPRSHRRGMRSAWLRRVAR